jgi:hypothetical protein
VLSLKLGAGGPVPPRRCWPLSNRAGHSTRNGSGCHDGKFGYSSNSMASWSPSFRTITSIGSVGLAVMLAALAFAYPETTQSTWKLIFWVGALLFAALPIWISWHSIVFLKRRIQRRIGELEFRWPISRRVRQSSLIAPAERVFHFGSLLISSASTNSCSNLNWSSSMETMRPL